MTRFYSASRKGFFDDAVHGTRTLSVIDEARLEELEARCLEEGEESDACALLSLPPPMREVANPACLLPEDAIALADEEYAALLAEANDGKDIIVDGNRPIAVEREVPVEDQLEALRRRRDRALAATDWSQLPDALTAARRKLWADHRKALRDLPALVEKAIKAGKPVDAVPFPAPPG